MIRVGVNGYGIIGKRVADAIVLQDDMTLIGVTYHNYDARIREAKDKFYNVMSQEQIEELVSNVDVMVDCTKHVGEKNKEIYAKAGIKAIFQGGEKESIGTSFVSQVNYSDAFEKQFVRVVSCNTTAICRVVDALSNINKVRISIVRRSSKGIVNTVVPDVNPSHQGEDAKCVLGDMDIVSTACSVPVALGHVHYMTLTTEEPYQDIMNELLKAGRIVVVPKQPIDKVLESFAGIGRPRGDMWEVAVLNDFIVNKNEIFLTYYVHNEAITIPEVIDAVRAVSGVRFTTSYRKTNLTLGI